MNATPSTDTGSKPGKFWLVLVILFCVPLLCVWGVASYFRLSSDTKALRRTLLSSVEGQWNTTIALNIGWLTTTLLYGGSQFLELPPEARAALSAIRGVEVGVYQIQNQPRPADYSAALAAADETMTLRGWERIVGVLEGEQCVAVYVPTSKVSAERMRCCVVVMSEGNLVLVSGRGNLKPLLDLASKRLADKIPALISGTRSS